MTAASALIWAYLLVFHARFWNVRDDSETVGPVPPRRVAVVIPARNEAKSIARAVSSLASQDFDGEVRIFVVDDDSSDGTAEVARAAYDKVEIVQAESRPAGWTGKMWAVSQGLERALALRPDYVLLTDADIEHAPGNLRSLVARAERDQLELASYMVGLENRSFAERAAIPAFVFFFLMLYPPRWIADPRRPTAGAAGGCMLVRTAALERIEGVARIRAEIIDDCALACQIKLSGGRLWLGLTTSTRSLRRYSGFGEIAHMIARTAFTQLRYSSLMLVGTVAGMTLLYVVPVLAVFSGNGLAAASGGFAWVCMAVSYTPMLRFYRQPLWWAPLLPAVAAFYTAATIQSAIRYWRGRGGDWKGRIQITR